MDQSKQLVPLESYVKLLVCSFFFSENLRLIESAERSGYLSSVSQEKIVFKGTLPYIKYFVI